MIRAFVADTVQWLVRGFGVGIMLLIMVGSLHDWDHSIPGMGWKDCLTIGVCLVTIADCVTYQGD